MEKEFKIKEIKIEVPSGMEIDKENSTFECIKFKPIENKLPNTWEEFCKTHRSINGENWITNSSLIGSIDGKIRNNRNCIEDKNLLPNKKYAEAMLALCQLIQLRDCYNDGWIPDWSDKNYKYVIIVEYNCIRKACETNLQRILAFESARLRNEFFENFRDLIEVAKPLL